MRAADLARAGDLRDASSDALPEGWAATTFGEISLPSKEKMEPDQWPDAPYLSLEHVESQTGRIIGFGCARDVISTKTVFRAGDVLYGKLRPYLNKVCIPERDGICSTDLLVFPRSKWLESRFLLWFLLKAEVVEFAHHHSSGVQLPRVDFHALGELDFPLAPLAEQKRIVAKVAELLTRVRATEERLTRIPIILKRFRQAVLAAACSGRLTADWREVIQNRNQDSIFLLKGLGDSASPAFVPDQDDPIEPYEVPHQWAWTRCENICDPNRAITYGVIKLGLPVKGGVPTLRSSDVRWLEIDTNQIKCISAKIASAYSRTFLQGGEVLVTVRGTLGGVAVAPSALAGHNVSREVAVLPVHSSLDPHFFAYVIGAVWSQNWLMQVTKGVAYTGINIRDLKRLPVPFPPVPEQHEIVRRVESLFKLADAIEKRVASATARTDKLTQSILAKAFRGDLVPTEAVLARREGRDYEPASVLLERIRKEREGRNPEAGPARQKRHRASARSAVKR